MNLLLRSIEEMFEAALDRLSRALTWADDDDEGPPDQLASPLDVIGLAFQRPPPVRPPNGEASFRRG